MLTISRSPRIRRSLQSHSTGPLGLQESRTAPQASTLQVIQHTTAASSSTAMIRRTSSSIVMTIRISCTQPINRGLGRLHRLKPVTTSGNTVTWPSIRTMGYTSPISTTQEMRSSTPTNRQVRPHGQRRPSITQVENSPPLPLIPTTNLTSLTGTVEEIWVMQRRRAVRGPSVPCNLLAISPSHRSPSIQTITSTLLTTMPTTRTCSTSPIPLAHG